MMYQELYRFLLQHKQLPVPGIGTFLLERRPAVIDFPNRKIEPPVYSVSLNPTSLSPSRQFFAWLGHALHISDRDAVIRFNDFIFDLKKQIAGGGSISWKGVGVISKSLSGDIKFVAEPPVAVEKPVAAEKVIRDKAEHMVRVGEEEKTSAEMTEMLNKTEEKRSYWWVPAAALALLAVMFIGWYFSEQGVDVSSTANSTKLVPLEPVSHYKAIQ